MAFLKEKRVSWLSGRIAMCAAVLVAVILSSGTPCRAQYDKDVFSFRGRNALADGKFSEAISNFNVLASLDTTDYWTFFYRGIAKYNLGDVRGAQQDFNTAVRLNPVFTSGYHYRAITYNRFGRYDEAIGDLERAMMLRPGYIGLYFTRGVTYFLSQQFEKAVADFDRYIRREPRDPSAFLNRGASYLFLGDTLKAMADYNRAIKLDRFEPEGYIRRGRLFAAGKEYDAAIADMNKAIELDTANTFAYFNRALMYYDRQQFNEAMADLNKVLEYEPGNALTLYNRSLISAQVNDYESALADMDRVININPKNVLAYYNRASFFIGMERWTDALEDYDKAIELYPDFAKAYMNRSYVEMQLGMTEQSKKDYDTASRKIREYEKATGENSASFADTTKKYGSLLALDADFAKKNFDDELLQHRDIDINLKPLYRFVLAKDVDGVNYALARKYENALLDRFIKALPLPVAVDGETGSVPVDVPPDIDAGDPARTQFLLALGDIERRQYNGALNRYDAAIENGGEGYDALYKAFYYMNRGVLRADMIDFIASMETNVQTLAMDDKGNIRARVRDQVSHDYDYSEALEDMESAAGLVDDIPYIHFNLGNLYCLSSKPVDAIESYDRAIGLYPYMGDAYFNRGLVLIYLKDKEKGCIDLSRAGELGIEDAYSVISRYCDEEDGGMQ